MAFGANSSAADAIRLLIEVDGLTNLEALKVVLGQVQDGIRANAEAMQAAGAPQEEIIKSTISLNREANFLQKTIATVEREMRSAGEATQEWADLQAKLAEMNQRSTDAVAANTTAVKANAAAVLDAARAGSEAADEWDKLQAALGRMEKASADAAQEAARDAVTVRDAAVKQFEAQTKAAEKAVEAQKSVAKSSYELAGAFDLVGDAEADVTTHTRAMQAAMAAEIKDLTGLTQGAKLTVAQLDELARAKMSAAVVSQKLGSETAATRSKFLQFGQTIDDMQYVGEMGLRPIINNIMQVAPTIGIALIAIEALRKTVGDDLLAEFNRLSGLTEKVSDSVGSLEEKIKELTEKPRKIAVDYSDLEAAKEKLDQLRKEEAAYNAAKGSKGEKDLAKTVQDTTQGYLGGSDELTGVVMGIDAKNGREYGTAQQINARNKHRQRLAGEIPANADELKLAEEYLPILEAEIRKANFEHAQKFVARFNAGNKRDIEAMQALVKANPDNFRQVGDDGRTAQQAVLDLPTTPQALAKKKADEKFKEEAEKARDQQDREREAAEEKARIAAEKKVDELNALGQENQLAGVADAEQKAKEARREEAAAERAKEANRRKQEAEARKDRVEQKRQDKADDREAFDADAAMANRHLQSNGFNPVQANQIAQAAAAVHQGTQGAMSLEAALQQTIALIQRGHSAAAARDAIIANYAAYVSNLQAQQTQMEWNFRNQMRRSQIRQPPLGPGRGGW